MKKYIALLTVSTFISLTLTSCTEANINAYLNNPVVSGATDPQPTFQGGVVTPQPSAVSAGATSGISTGTAVAGVAVAAAIGAVAGIAASGNNSSGHAHSH